MRIHSVWLNGQLSSQLRTRRQAPRGREAQLRLKHSPLERALLLEYPQELFAEVNDVIEGALGRCGGG